MEFALGSLLAHEGFGDPRILAAVMRVDRAAFAPPGLLGHAHEDLALPLGFGRYLLRPSVVARMLSALRPRAGDRVLILGAGAGYETALLGELGCDIYAIENVPLLAEMAALNLARLGVRARLRVTTGTSGWPDEAPFHRILACWSFTAIPDVLRRQVGDSGRLVAPIGDGTGTRIVAAERHATGWTESVLDALH